MQLSDIQAPLKPVKDLKGVYFKDISVNNLHALQKTFVGYRDDVGEDEEKFLFKLLFEALELSLIHISEPTRPY